MNLVISHFSDERLQGEDKPDENPNKDTNNNDDEELEIEDGKEDALTNLENESSDPIFGVIRIGRRLLRRVRRRRSRRRRRLFG